MKCQRHEMKSCFGDNNVNESCCKYSFWEDSIVRDWEIKINYIAKDIP